MQSHSALTYDKKAFEYSFRKEHTYLVINIMQISTQVIKGSYIIINTFNTADLLYVNKYTKYTSLPLHYLKFSRVSSQHICVVLM